MMAIKEGKVVVVTSTKGGTGKTNFAMNLAANMKSKTLLLDLDFAGKAVAASLDVVVKYDVADLLCDLENKKFNNVENYVVNYQDTFDILAAPNDPRKITKLDLNYIDAMLHHLRMKYECIIIDTNHNVSKLNLLLFDLVDEIVFITTPNLIDLKNLKTMINIFDNIKKENYKIILNRACTRVSDYYNDSEVRGLLEDNIDYVIPKSAYEKNYEANLLAGKLPMKKEKIMQKIAQAIGGEK